MPLYFTKKDITTLSVDAIVNAANRELLPGGGVCGDIFDAAGKADMEGALKGMGPIETGQAVMTPGFALPAKAVIHTAGPIWKGTEDDKKRLASCYTNSLALAEKEGFSSVAFPVISSGIYGCPMEIAKAVAIDAITSYVAEHPMKVYIVLYHFDKKTSAFPFDDFYNVLHEEYVVAESVCYGAPPDTAFEDGIRSYSRIGKKPDAAPQKALRSRQLSKPTKEPAVHYAIDECLCEGTPDFEEEPFNVCLFRLIDERHLSDPDVYKNANLSRQLFSKIRSRKSYIPGKKTILALACALKLTGDEADDLLEHAGYSLSRFVISDQIVRYCFDNNIHDIYIINEALMASGRSQLGGA